MIDARMGAAAAAAAAALPCTIPGLGRTLFNTGHEFIFSRFFFDDTPVHLARLRTGCAKASVFRVFGGCAVFRRQ